MPEYIASLDIGSNTIVTLVAEREGLRFVDEFCVVAQLGAGLKEGVLSEEAIQRGCRAIWQEVVMLRMKYPGARLVAGATAAVREAANGPAFMARVAEQCKLLAPPVIFKGEEEAALTFEGASSDLIPGTPCINADPGGASTELSRGIAAQEPDFCNSFQVGCVRWRDRFQLSDRPSTENIEDAYQAALESFPRLTFGNKAVFTISGGTSHVAASLITGRKIPATEKMQPITREQVVALRDRLCSMTAAERRMMPGMFKNRESVVPAGSIILLALMDALQQKEFLPSYRGIRDGMLQRLRDGRLTSLL